MALALEFHLGVWRKYYKDNSYSGREVNMSKYMSNKIPDLLDPVWSDRTHFYLLNLQENKRVVFPSLPPSLLICLFKMAKFRVTDGHYIEKFFTNKSYLFPSEFSRGNGSDLGSCWIADKCPWLSHGVGLTCDGCEAWCGHFPLVRASSAVLSSLAVLLPRLKSIVCRTGWPSEHHLLHPLFTITFCWNGVLYCAVACPRELARMLSANESTGCFICALEKKSVIAVGLIVILKYIFLRLPQIGHILSFRK